MAKVTSKYQVTIPKAIAERYGIEPGDDIAWVPAGDGIRVLPEGVVVSVDASVRLKLFDEATDRQRKRSRRMKAGRAPVDRGWTREDLYRRGRAR